MTDDEILLQVLGNPARRRALAKRLAGVVASTVGVEAKKRVGALTEVCDTTLKTIHAEAAAPLRRVVDQFVDWRGPMQELECGHFIKGRGSLPCFATGGLHCTQCAETGTGGEVVALHDIRCGCYRCTGREANP